MNDIFDNITFNNITFNNITFNTTIIEDKDNEDRYNIGLDILSHFLIIFLSLFLLGFVITLARICINACFENNTTSRVYLDFESNIEENKINKFEIIQSNGFKDYFIECDFKDDSTCSICLENIKNNRVEIINCNHYFHKNCLIEWFQKGKINCPNCRDTF